MKLAFLLAARLEEREATAHYRMESSRLALKYRSELKQTLERILMNPNQFPLVTAKERRALVSNFPYAVFFQTRKDAILVIAIAHTSREPSYWRNR